MRVKLLCAAFAMGAIPSLAVADETTVESINYACADNEILRVVYVNGADGKGFAIVQQMDDMIPMAQEVSASGAIYTAINPDYTYTLLTKGEEATLEDDNGVILQDCSM